MSEVTWVDKDICVCNNCGAYSNREKSISHYKTCKPGESKKWEKIYEDANQEEELCAY